MQKFECRQYLQAVKIATMSLTIEITTSLERSNLKVTTDRNTINKSTVNAGSETNVIMAGHSRDGGFFEINFLPAAPLLNNVCH